MRRKDYRGAKCIKRTLPKCEGVCKTFDNIQYAYADLLSMSEDVQSFKVNVLLEGHGHYNLPHHDDCVEIFEEYYTAKEE